MKIEEKDSPSKNDQIEAYLSAQYEFRYNTVLHRAEYRPQGKGDYTAVDRYRINTLKRALDKEANIQTSTDNLYSIIESDFSPRINPVQEYFRALPLTKGNAEAITALADCVQVTNSEKWEELPYQVARGRSSQCYGRQAVSQSHLPCDDISSEIWRLIWRNKTSHLAEYDVSFGGIWRLIFQSFQNDLSRPALPTSSIRLPLYRKDFTPSNHHSALLLHSIWDCCTYYLSDLLYISLIISIFVSCLKAF